jgi:hypothetical protein
VWFVTSLAMLPTISNLFLAQYVPAVMKAPAFQSAGVYDWLPGLPEAAAMIATFEPVSPVVIDAGWPAAGP